MSSRAWCCSRRRRKRLWRRSWRRAPGERRGRRHALSSRSRVQSAYIPSSNTIPCSCDLRMRDKQSSVRAADAMAIERARVLHYANKQLTHPFSCARRRVRQVWAHLLDQHMICKWLGAERCGHRAKLWLRTMASKMLGALGFSGLLDPCARTAGQTFPVSLVWLSFLVVCATVVVRLNALHVQGPVPRCETCVRCAATGRVGAALVLEHCGAEALIHGCRDERAARHQARAPCCVYKFYLDLLPKLAVNKAGARC